MVNGRHGTKWCGVSVNFYGRWSRTYLLSVIKKGDVIFSSRPTTVTTKFCRRFSLNDPKVFSTNLVVYDGTVEGNDPQQRQQRFASIPAGKKEREQFCLYPLSNDSKLFVG
jgi:hypothetical protein